ncbi:hypothetical protein [Draconibacterium orientale]|uniref:hypothetical protein n=1 Tax=Draconibacterium orientale TaxID=1168034 RepID=UPI002ABE6AC4|nr:hypothetical protein [Draconibacterium orientale]
MKKQNIILFFSMLLMLSCQQSVEYYIPEIKNLNLELTSSNNLPVSNYIVKLYSQYNPDVVLDNNVSNLDGKVTFGSLAPTSYLVKIFANSGSEEIESVPITVEGADTEINMPVSLDMSISLYDFTVYVNEEESGRVMKNRKVIVSTDKDVTNIVAEGITDSEGKITFQQVKDYTYYINVYGEEGVSIAKQLSFGVGRNSTSYSVTISLPRRILHNADFVITGLMVNLKGYDCKDVGFVSWDITYPGEFEYVQFMALKDIDFRATSYCMVTSWNGTPTPMGWVEGKNGNRTTYQINIDEGTVKKGDFFIVGGRSRLLCGINEDYISPSISADKWIVTKNFYSAAGDDGNGAPAGGYGILDGGGEADGVAVFRGTTIDENTVPMDAVFFGANLSSTHYYQIPDNDLYSRINAETNEEQPYFGMGSNTTTMGKSLGDVGDFYLLGGKVSPEAWIIPRTPDQHVRLNWKEVTPTLDMIETGPNVTIFTDDE